MQYFKDEKGEFTPLAKKNVDTGMGLERTLCILNGYSSVYETDLFDGARAKIEELTGKSYSESEEVKKAFRIILDHTRTAVFMIGDQKGITPSNVDQGYVLRRLIRRAVRYGRKINLPDNSLSLIAERYIEKYAGVYPELSVNAEKIKDELNKEEAKFSKSLQNGLKEFDKVIKSLQGDTIDGVTAFHLYDTYGFPVEITEELAKENGVKVDLEGFKKAFLEHQEKSHAGSEQRFKGGLADTKEETARLHTATHLLQAGLKKFLSQDIMQKGSNITAERLRFDFNFPRPCTKEELKQVEDYVNFIISQDVPVEMREMTVEEAKAEGAIGVFDSKYGDKVKVYKMGEYSMEICGGPHASRTGELGKFKITKEQSSSAGIRRIKAEISPIE